jgi:phosphotriesterase-related protein
MKQVNTTLGLISLDQLGKVNMHDHVILDRSHNERIPEDFHHTDIDLISSDLLAWKAAYGGAIVDSSPIGAGRNVQLLNEISQVSQVPIIVTTGFHKLSYYPQNHWLFRASTNELVDIFIKECTDGILMDEDQPFDSGKHSVKANIVKIGVDKSGLTPVIRKIIDATAAVIDGCGTPCMIHTEPGVPFEEVIGYVEQRKIHPSKVMICHMGKSLDPRLLGDLAEKGFFLEFDEMIRAAPPLDFLVQSIISLFDDGYKDNVLFAGDLARRSYWTCYGGEPGLAYLVTALDDRLMALGFTPEMLKQVWVENPKRYFA